MMSFRDFSAALIRSGDLDPDYLVMKAYVEDRFEIIEDQRNELVNWAIHKAFIYDTASEICYLFGGPKGRYQIDELVHGAERRKNRRNTVEQLEAFRKGVVFPEGFLTGDTSIHYRDFKKIVTGFAGMGPWASWKLADLFERTAGLKVDFSVDFREAYAFPLKGLCRVNNMPDEFITALEDNKVYLAFMNNSIKELGPVWNYEAPGGGRAINLQELETCLCKYHSYLAGHYKIGQDTRHVLDRFRVEGLTVPPKVGAFFNQFIDQNLFG